MQRRATVSCASIIFEQEDFTLLQIAKVLFELARDRQLPQGASIEHWPILHDFPECWRPHGPCRMISLGLAWQGLGPIEKPEHLHTKVTCGCDQQYFEKCLSKCRNQLGCNMGSVDIVRIRDLEPFLHVNVAFIFTVTCGILTCRPTYIITITMGFKQCRG
jgi:hypothetical protein